MELKEGKLFGQGQNSGMEIYGNSSRLLLAVINTMLLNFQLSYLLVKCQKKIHHCSGLQNNVFWVFFFFPPPVWVTHLVPLSIRKATEKRHLESSRHSPEKDRTEVLKALNGRLADQAVKVILTLLRTLLTSHYRKSICNIQ